MNNECETLEHVEIEPVNWRDEEAMIDLYKVLARLGQTTNLATARRATEALREACREGRLYGLSFGFVSEGGSYIGCGLAHLGHAVDPVRYEDEGQCYLEDLMNYPHYGYKLEEYVMYIPSGATPEHNQYVANISTWCDNYLSS